MEFQKGRLTVREVFDQIKIQSGLGIAYGSRALDTDRTVTFPAGSVEVRQALEKVLANTGLSYVVISDVITIKPAVELGQEPIVTTSVEPAGPLAEPKPVDQEVPAERRAEGSVIVVRSRMPYHISLPQLDHTTGYYPVENYSVNQGHYPMLAVKINILYAGAAFTPNLAVEAGLTDNITLGVSASHNPWKRKGDFESNKKLVHSIFKAEVRYWTCSRFNGHYVGAYPMYARYNIGSHKIPLLFKKQYRYDGHAIGGGVSYGYHLMLSRQWGLEFSAGAGVARMNYKKYDCAVCNTDYSREKKTFFGPTDLGLRLVFMIK